MTLVSDLWRALAPVADALEALAVPYYIGGSVASSYLGVARATQDVDLVAALEAAQAAPFEGALAGKYYVSRERIEQAIRTRRSFNVIHLETMYKVDIFVPEATRFARERMLRRVEREIPDLGRSLPFSSPEDIVLQKLRWFVDGGSVSDRQWSDLQGVLRLQGPRLDRAYLETWATELGISDLLTRALAEAGLGT